MYLIVDLLPGGTDTERGGTEGLRTMVQKFEKHHPGTVNNLFALASRRIVQAEVFGRVGSYVLFLAVAWPTVVIVYSFFNEVPWWQRILVLATSGILGILGWWLSRFDKTKPLKFETFQNTRDFLYWFSILENELDHLEGGFAELKQKAEAQARGLAILVLKDEKRVKDNLHPSFAEDLALSRRMFKNFHSACWKTGLLDPEYGKYFEGVEVPESDHDPRITVVK